MSALLNIPGVSPPVAVPAELLVEVVASTFAPVAPPAVVVKPLKPKPDAGVSRRLRMGLLAIMLLGGGASTYYFLMQEEPSAPPPVVHRPVAPLVPKVEPAAPLVVSPSPTPVPTSESLGLDPLLATPGAQPAAAVVAAKLIKAPVAPVMTPAFRRWIEGVRINGVTASAGSVPRVIINGRLVLPGDTIDSAEGIVFESVDTEHKCVLFRDRAGFVAPKPY